MTRHVRRSRGQLLTNLVLLALALLVLLLAGSVLGGIGTVELGVILGLGLVGTVWLCHRHLTQGRA